MIDVESRFAWVYWLAVIKFVRWCPFERASAWVFFRSGLYDRIAGELPPEALAEFWTDYRQRVFDRRGGRSM